MKRSLRKGIVALLALAISSGCAVQIPDFVKWPAAPPQLAANKHAFVYDEVKACVDKLNRLQRTAKMERNAAAAFSIGGGLLGVASGTVSGVLDKDNESTKNILAFIAAGGALLAVIAPVIGNPKDTIKEHNTRAGAYELVSDAIFQLNMLAAQEPPKPDPTDQPEEKARKQKVHDLWEGRVYELINRVHLATGECTKVDLSKPSTLTPLPVPTTLTSAVPPAVSVPPAGSKPPPAPNSPSE